MAIQALRFLIGAALLLLGREFYWLFVASVGFVVAADLAPRVVQIEPSILLLVIALAAGVVGALLAVLLQEAAIGLAGFLAGGYAAIALLDLIELPSSPISWILALVGGVIGVVLILALFDWALIILSSITGAWTITRALEVRTLMTGLIFLVLLMIGLAAQASMMRRGRTRAGRT